MLRQLVAEAWADSPARCVAAIAAVPLVVAAAWVALVVLIVAGTPA
jgi:hypothetical protein